MNVASGTYVRITEALVGGRVGNPRGLTGLALARGQLTPGVGTH